MALLASANLTARDPIVVVLFVDALGAVIARDHAFLADRGGHGYTLETVIGYSSSAIPSLLTGTLPREHGHFSMYRRDMGEGIFRSYRPLMWLAHHTRGRGKLRQLLKARLSKSISGYFELYDLPLDQLAEFDLTQRRDIWMPGGLAPHETFVDLAERAGIPYEIWSWKTKELDAFERLLRVVKEGKGGFYLLYTAELDALMHRVGVGDPRVREKLDVYAGWLSKLERAAAGRPLRYFVASDHGMTDIRESHDVHGSLAATGLSTPRDYLVFTDSTMARFWFRRKEAEAALRAALPDTAWARWLGRREVSDYGIDFEDRRYGEAIYLLEPGHVIAPSFMGERACAAMHGYGPEDPTCKAWLFASEPPSPAPTSILDLKAVFGREIERLRVGAGSPA